MAEAESASWSHIRAQWTAEQLELKQRLREVDHVQWHLRDSSDEDTCAALAADTTANTHANDVGSVASLEKRRVQRLAGVDISFLKGSNEHACASIVVLQYPSLQVVYEAFTYVSLPAPYIAGFLAFREVPALTKLYGDLLERCPELMPDVTLVDGNGVLHPQGFGLASHFGVLMGIPTIGVGKTFLHVDGLTKGDVKTLMAQAKSSNEQVVKLQGESGKVWGAALCSATGVQNPVFVSVGHMISLDSSLEIVDACSQFRIPEPIRQADIRSRQVIREWEKRGVNTTLDSYSVASGTSGSSTSKSKLSVVKKK